MTPASAAQCALVSVATKSCETVFAFSGPSLVNYVVIVILAVHVDAAAAVLSDCARASFELCGKIQAL